MQTAMDQIEIFVDGLIRRSRLRAIAKAVIAAQRLEKKAFNYLSTADRNDLRSLVRSESKSVKLSRLGRIQGLAQRLNTDLRMGIGFVTSTPTSERDELLQSENLKQDLALRRHVFGMNTHSIKQSKSVLIWRILKRNFKLGRIQNVYILCGVILLALAIINPHLKWSTGLTILIVTIINAGSCMGIDFCLSNHLQNLALQREEHVQAHVIRCGRTCSVSTCEIVVGDLVELSCGDQVPADGLLVESNSSRIIEGTNQLDQRTSCSDSTFLTSGSIVQKSFCLMLVTAVGKDTQWGGHRSSTESDMSHESTFLMQFRTSQDLLEKLMLYIMFLFLLILSLDFIVLRSVYLEETYGIAEVIYKLVYKFYDSLTFILTLVPSSLFSSFSLALLYFIPRMSADGALIMKLETCSRKLGSITTICTGKAGLLTYAEMEVMNSWVAADLQEGEDRTTQSLSAMPEDVQDLLLEGLVLNSGSRSAKSCCGRTEKALLRWGQVLLGWDHQDSMGFETIRQRYSVLKLEPFDSERKRSGAFLRRERDGNCVVHWKGAPSTILSSCSRWICADGKSGRTTIRTLSEHDRIIIEAKIANMENTGLRCVAFAYCELGRAAPNSIGQAASGGMQLGDCSLAHISSQEVDLTLLAMVGMKETCRPEASEEVRKARNAGLRVIMVTGDSIEAARVIAKECGIIEESINIEEQVVDGSTFREWTLSNRQERLQRLTVLARASDHDKQLLVASLQANDEEVVAVTGDKHTDVDILQRADVAFSLGSHGKQVAIESSDIILLDDSFTSILKAIEWGRCMRCNLEYFLHFQITMSVVTPLISQLSGTQFQWIDLITMLASIAVIMQPPLPSLMLQPRPLIFPKHLYTNIMFRNFILQAMYQVILFSVIINYTDADLNRTIVFNSFIFCQVINIVTARQLHIFQSLRRLYSHMDNSHEGLLKVKIFLRWCGTNIIQKNLLLMALITIIAIMQVVLIQFAGHTFSSTRLKWNQWLFCVGFALGSWVVGVFGERLPMPNTPRLMDFVC